MKGKIPTATAEQIVRAVSAHYGVTAVDIRGRGRSGSISGARHAVAALLYRCTGMSSAEIGRFLGGRSHTTALRSIRIGGAAADEISRHW